MARVASWMPWAVVAVLGLITGSFLNAVIHRLPRGISLMDPRRSFCPGCGRMIPWHENLPVLSWVMLRGRCSGCAGTIGLRYPVVELLTAGLYLLAWERFGLPLAAPYWILLALLVAATFIDIDHLIIPDEITVGGAGAGMLCAALVPAMTGSADWREGILRSLGGALSGYLLLWGVVELGKLAFGRRWIRSDDPMELEILGSESDPVLKLGGEEVLLEEVFCRKGDRVEAVCTWLEIDGEKHGSGKAVLTERSLAFEGREWMLADAVPVRAGTTRVMIPREAMGFGDVKFLACIGSFLGWKGVVFSLFAGSVVGSVAGVILLLCTGGRSGGRIPFGPYLAIGAVLWVFAGSDLLARYGDWASSFAGVGR